VIYLGSPPATIQRFGQEYKDADGHLSQSFLWWQGQRWLSKRRFYFSLWQFST